MEKDKRLTEVWDFWSSVIDSKPESGVIFREFKSGNTGELIVWIIDDLFDNKRPESIADERVLCLALVKSLVQFGCVSRVVVCTFDQETITYLQKTHLKQQLAQEKVCLVLDIFNGDENAGKQLVHTLVAENEHVDPSKVPRCQSSVCAKKGDNYTTGYVQKVFTKISSLGDDHEYEEYKNRFHQFFEECENRHRSLYRKRAAEDEMEALSDRLRRFHDSKLVATSHDSNHEVSDCLNHSTDSFNSLTQFATQGLIQFVVAAIKKSQCLGSQTDALFDPLRNDSLGHELSFSLSKSLSLRSKTGLNYIPGYWLSLFLDSTGCDLKRRAFELSEQVSFAAFLATLDRLKDKFETRAICEAGGGSAANGAKPNPLLLKLTMKKGIGDWNFFFNQVSTILSQDNPARFPEGKHGTFDALANMRLAGFKNWQICKNNASDGDQLVLEGSWPIEKIKLLD